MNRRSIFKTIAGALCAAAIEVCGVEPVSHQIVKINPDWECAPCEEMLMSDSHGHWVLMVKRDLSLDAKQEEKKLIETANRHNLSFNRLDYRFVFRDDVYHYVPKYIFKP